jgi:type II secretory pathway predicted ATPase ExeA
LIVVTGEVGTGKTTILRWIMHRLDRTVLVGYIFNPRMAVEEFYQYVSSPKLLDIQEWRNKSELLLALGRTLEARHARGLRTVLIVDEAHGLSTAVLEEIRLLSNFESDSAKQLQIILTGQPELRDVLNNPELRQLKQRVALRCEIKALPNIEETERYITSRLLVAGAERTDIFSPGAIDYVYRCSEGIPRQINNLCDNALLAGYSAGAETISRSIIEEVAATFDMLPSAMRGRQLGEEREAPARIFTATGRAELWAAGAGAVPSVGGANREASGAGRTPALEREETAENFSDESGVLDLGEQAAVTETDDVGTAFRRWDHVGEM